MGITLTNQNYIHEETFGLKRGEITGGCRNLHEEGFHDLYTLPYVLE
jgi:hypothetical protein